MHTVWKGSISFGLVNIPVRMFTATEERDIRFRQLHSECHTPIRYAKICPHCDREVQQNELIRGYEYEKGNFVIIKDEDIDKITPETRKAVEILDFVDLSEIDPIFFDKSYFLSPQDTGDKAYSLLRAAMEHTGKIAIARITLRNRESLAVLRIFQNCLVLETIYYPDEVRSVEKVPALPAGDFKVADNELRMAEQLVESMSAPFEPTKYTDTYREDLHRMIQQKLEGQEVTAAPAAQKTNVIDLMAALQASIAAVVPAGTADTEAVAGADNGEGGKAPERELVAVGTGVDSATIPATDAPAATKPKKTTRRKTTAKKLTEEPAASAESHIVPTEEVTATIDQYGNLTVKPAREVVERYPEPRGKVTTEQPVDTQDQAKSISLDTRDDGTTVTKKLRRKKTTTT